MNGQDPVAAYLAAEADADAAENTMEQSRWEACRIVHTAVSSGEYSRRSFAKAVGKTLDPIRWQYKIWQRWGDHPGLSRPSYRDAYDTIRGGSVRERLSERPTAEQADEPFERHFRQARSLLGNVVNFDWDESQRETLKTLLRQGIETIEDHQQDRAEPAEDGELAELAHKADQAQAREAEQSKQQPALRHISADDYLTKARRFIDQATEQSRGVAFTDEERELLADTVRGVQDALNTCADAINGVGEADLDAELRDLTGGST